MADKRGMDMAQDLLDQVSAERALARDLEDFKGQWVAVNEHKIVAHAPNLDELMQQIDVDNVEAVFEVAEVQSTAWYF